MNYVSVYTETTNKGHNLNLFFCFGDRKFNMSRVGSEAVGKALKRIGISVQKAFSKREDGARTKARKQDVLNEIPVALFFTNGEAVNNELSNVEAWKDGNILIIGESKFLVEENTPIVRSAKIPSVNMAGFPVVPTLKLEFADEANSQFKWYRKAAIGTFESNPVPIQAECANENETEWTEISQEFIYIPTVSDIGCVLKLSCKAADTEKAAHEWYDVTATSEVAAGPGILPFDSRHVYTSKPVSDSAVFRVVCYNILADCYLQDEAICQAWFGYCPKYALAIDYRQQLLLKEIIGYHGDIVCLQECGRRLFNDYLNPMMASRGYTGVVKYKSGVMPEGEAIFFNNSKFTLISQHNFELKDSLINDTCNKELLERVCVVPKIHEKLTSRTTVAQIIVLHCIERPLDYICVVNTHLYFRPNAPCIRNLQTMIVLNMLRKTIQNLDSELKEKHNHSYQIGVVCCGDFNSLPWSGVVQLLTDGILPNHHPDWTIPVEEPGQTVASLEMTGCHHEFALQNCCGFPEFTTYTEGFSGVIDYIFASKKYFEVDSVIPLPSKEELQLYTAIPSPVMPSDHIALICELKWK